MVARIKPFVDVREPDKPQPRAERGEMRAGGPAAAARAPTQQRLLAGFWGKASGLLHHTVVQEGRCGLFKPERVTDRADGRSVTRGAFEWQKHSPADHSATASLRRSITWHRHCWTRARPAASAPSMPNLSPR